MTDPDDERFTQLSDMITEAADQLAVAHEHLEDLQGAAVGLTAMLFGEEDPQ